MVGWKENGKGTPLAGSAFNMNPPPMGLDNGADNVEPQTDAFFISGARLCGPVKPAEDLLLLILGKADSSINNLQGGPIGIRVKR